VTAVAERRQAVVFDMDDTLYAERRFVLSGFAAVAEVLGSHQGIEAREAFRVLARALRQGRRQMALQLLCRRYGLPESMVRELVQVIRAHVPRLRLPRTTARVLAVLRPTWRLGVLTNGVPAIQARKVAALGLGAMVDQVVFASAHGTGAGKPDSAPFLAMSECLAVEPGRCVFVGDDPVCDIAGARRVGMRSVQIRASARQPLAASIHQRPDSFIESLSELPHVAASLLEERYGYVNHHRTPPRRT